MAKHKISVPLTKQGIRQLQSELNKYMDDVKNKARELAEKLSERGITVMQCHISESPLGKYVSVKTDITPEMAGCRAALIATGQTMESEGYAPFNTLLAIEFGAGIHHNKIPNPNADKFGLGVGTFPGQIHAFEDYWFYWNEEEQKWLPTHGVRATMPMYNASMAIASDVVKIAKEVFDK